jgi:hypothetical protein
MMVPRDSTVFAGIPRLPGPVRFHQIFDFPQTIEQQNSSPPLLQGLD